jgi:hypothetical protein
MDQRFTPPQAPLKDAGNPRGGFSRLPLRAAAYFLMLFGGYHASTPPVVPFMLALDLLLFAAGLGMLYAANWARFVVPVLCLYPLSAALLRLSAVRTVNVGPSLGDERVWLWVSTVLTAGGALYCLYVALVYLPRAHRQRAHQKM